MNKQFLKKVAGLAEQLGLSYDEKSWTIFGTYNGFYLCLLPLGNTYAFTLYLSLSQQDHAVEADLLKELVSSTKMITARNVQGYRIQLTTKAGMTAAKTTANVREALDTATQFFKEHGLENCCEESGQTDPVDMYIVRGVPAFLCKESYAKLDKDISKQEEQRNQIEENIVAGSVGALAGALIGVAAIVILGQLGYVAALSGIVLAVCTLKGYEMLAGSLSKKGLLVTVIVMLLMVYIGNRLDWSISMANYYADATVFESFRALPALIREGYLQSSGYYGNLALVYLFTAVGAIPTVRNMLRSKEILKQTYPLQ